MMRTLQLLCTRIYGISFFDRQFLRRGKAALKKMTTKRVVICVAGFLFKEKIMLENFLRAAARSFNRWELTDCIDAATIVVLNAPQISSIEEWRPMLVEGQQVLLIGPSDFASNWPVMKRPFSLGEIFDRLRQLTDMGHA